MPEDFPVRLAATVLLVRDGADGLEVFMVKRHHAIDFASGALVFPGGKVEADDHAIAADPARSGLLGVHDVMERAPRVAAIRETFEECGVLLARPRGGRDLVGGAAAAALAAMAEKLAFSELLARENLELALETLTPFAHWITPPIMHKRFDTHFYITAAPADQRAAHDGWESVDSIWVSPRQALAEAEAGRHTLVFATKLNLQMLARSGDAASAIGAARERRIVSVEPIATKTETGYSLRIPIEAGYDGDVFSI